MKQERVAAALADRFFFLPSHVFPGRRRRARPRPEARRKRTEPQGAIVVVDPMSTGANLALEAASRRGLPVVCVWSDVCPKELRSFVACDDVKWAGEVHHEAGGIKATCAALQSIGDIAEVIVGSEPGIELADELASAKRIGKLRCFASA